MYFWFAAALLTLGASLAVLAPLARRNAVPPGSGDYDIEVYKDQLAELERDVSRGLIQASEAEEARAEIGRRILKAASAGAPAATGSALLPERRAGVYGRVTGVAAVLAVPLVSWGFYAWLGSPDLPSQPLQQRLAANPQKNTIQEMIQRVEAIVAANPDDGKAWDVLGPIYMRLGRAQDAVTAFGNAIRLEGASAEREAGLGESIAMVHGGKLTEEARAAFGRALELDPGNLVSRYFLAAALSQDGRFEEASAAWSAMLTDLPPDSPWRPAIQQVLDEVGRYIAGNGDGQPAAPGDGQPAAPGEGQSAGAAGGQSAVPGLTQEEMDAAASMSEAERAEMIETMVTGLDERLKQNPQDIAGWQRLLRSYMILNHRDKAAAALERAVAAFGEGSPEAQGLVEFAAGLGLRRTE